MGKCHYYSYMYVNSIIVFVTVFTAATGDEGDGLPHPETVLCPENRLDYSWKYPEGGCGLVNRGNTCFVNAALQCLTYTPPLVNYLLSGHHSSECKFICCGSCTVKWQIFIRDYFDQFEPNVRTSILCQ